MKDQSFPEWIRTHWKACVAIATPLIAPLPLSDLARSFLESRPIGECFTAMTPNALNAVGILVILIFVGRSPLTATAKYKDASEKIEEFHLYWHWVWALWFVQYFYQTILSAPLSLDACDMSNLQTIYTRFDSNQYLFDIGQSIIGDALTLALLLCYVSIARFNQSHGILGLAIAFLVVGVFVDTLWILYTGSLQPLPKALGELALGTLWGMLRCVVLALLIGRIESRIIAAPLVVIVLMYFYASLQVLMPVLDAIRGMSEQERLAVDLAPLLAFVGPAIYWLKIIVLPLKALFFLFVFWLLESGRLLFYMNWMIRARVPRTGIDKERDEFITEVKLSRIDSPHAPLSLDTK